MNPNKALWEKGDFTRIAEGMRANGELFVHSLGIRRGDKVMDLGCGDGTTALPAAQLGAEVLGVDIAENLIAAGKARAAAAGLANLTFEQGDASNLAGIADHRFDWVVSVFGAMFAPRPDDVAREMVRVTKPGGTIVMGNWIAGDPTLVAQVLNISAAYTPPPPEGFVSPVTWGMDDKVIERFTGAGVARDRIRLKRDSFLFDFQAPPAAAVDLFRRYYGPTMNAFDAADRDGRADDLRGELEELFTRQNQSDSADRTRIPATFLRVTVKP